MSYNGLFVENQSFRYEQNVYHNLKKTNTLKPLSNENKDKVKLKFIAPKGNSKKSMG